MKLTLVNTYGDDVKVRAKAAAAAAPDARMSGCELPVVINSGSGNQGLTVSPPAIEYVKELPVRVCQNGCLFQAGTSVYMQKQQSAPSRFTNIMKRGIITDTELERGRTGEKSFDL